MGYMNITRSCTTLKFCFSFYSLTTTRILFKFLKLSIIIPSYNSKFTLRKCLESIYSSDFADFEVIVVDDKSTDDSWRIAEGFCVKLLRNKARKGQGYCRNEREIAGGAPCQLRSLRQDWPQQSRTWGGRVTIIWAYRLAERWTGLPCARPIFL